MAKAKNDILFRFLSDTKGLEKGTKRSSKAMGGVQSAARNMAGTLAAAFGAREIVRFGKDAVDSASDFAESVNAVEVATGDASDEILRLGKTAATELGLSKTAVNEAAVAFAAFGEKINKDDVGGVFEEFIGRATDFASVMNLDVDDALTKFQAGLAGETEPLRRFGIDISAASTKAFAFANGIGEIGQDLTEGEKVQARYGLLLQQTGKFAGDFANTSGELANQQRIANAEWENSKIVLGEGLLPLMLELTKVAGQAARAVPNMASDIDFAFQTLDRRARGFLSTISFGLVNAWDDAAVAADKYDRISKFISKRMDEGADATNLAAGALIKLADESAFTEKNIESLTEATDLTRGGMNDAMLAALQWAEANGGSLVSIFLLKEALRKINPVMGDTRDITDQYGSANRDAAAEVRGLKDATGDLQEELDVFDAGNAIQAMRDFITLNDLRFGRLPSTGGIGGQHPGDILGLAHGGTIQPGGVALVGEQGPEIIQPRGGAKITPMGKGGGGTTVNVTFTGVIGDPVETAQTIVDLIELHGRTNAG